MPSSAAVADDAPPSVRLLEEEGGLITLEFDEPPGLLEPDYRLIVELPDDHPIIRSHGDASWYRRAQLCLYATHVGCGSHLPTHASQRS